MDFCNRRIAGIIFLLADALDALVYRYQVAVGEIEAAAGSGRKGKQKKQVPSEPVRGSARSITRSEVPGRVNISVS